MDERAFDYLKMAPAEVQQRVMSTFNPPAVQSDYSKLVTAHVKFCLMQQREHRSTAQTIAPQSTPQVASSALVPAGATAGALGLAQLAAATQGMVSTRNSVSTEELELFRRMYPMDDRAYDYLGGAPPEVQERVIDTFNVSEVQADYSRAITAHVKFCLKQHKEQTPSLIALPTGTDAAQAAASSAVTMLAEFRHKFPTDDRAWNYLLQSSAEVKQRVLTEFCPPTGVEGDFSKAVTAYIRRCRDDEKNRATASGVASLAAAGVDLSALLGQGAALGTDLSALLGQGAGAGLDLGALLGQGASTGFDLGQGTGAGMDLNALLGQQAAAGTDALSASLSQLGSLATLIRAQAPTAALAGGDEAEGNAAKRRRTDGSSSSNFEQAALALTGAHWTAA